MSYLFDSFLSIYLKVFPWKFRDRFGSPLITLLMALKGNKVQFKDYQVFLNPRDKTATELFLIHVNAGQWLWESYELNLFAEAIAANQNPVVIDIGANYGAYTLSACSVAKGGHVRNVIAVEPNRETFSCLKRSVESSGFSRLAMLRNAAISDDHNSECDFYVDERYSAMSCLARPGNPSPPAENTSSYRVRCISIDGLLSESNIDKTGNFVIKIDVEGSEPLAFRGLADTLECAGGYQVFFEFHPAALKASGYDPLNLAQHLFDLQPDLIAEIDQHEKRLKRLNTMADFEIIAHNCLTTTEPWKDYTNIYLSKGSELPAEMHRLVQQGS
jgi:FkbM family methyltransferase